LLARRCSLLLPLLLTLDAQPLSLVLQSRLSLSVQLTAELRRLRSTAKKALMSVNTHKGSVPAGFGKNINFYVSGPLDADIMILLHAEDGDNPVLWGLVQQSIINELRKRMGLPPTTVDDIAAALAKEAEAAATATAAGSGAGAAAAAAPAAKPGARLSLAKELGIDLSDAPPLLASLFAEHDALAVVSKDVTIAAMHPFERLQLLDDDIAKFRSTLASLAQATDIATAQELAEAWEKTTSRRRAAAVSVGSCCGLASCVRDSAARCRRRCRRQPPCCARQCSCQCACTTCCSHVA